MSARYNLTDFVGDKADQFSAVAAVAENNPRYWETAAFVFLLASVFYVMVICVIRDRISLAVRCSLSRPSQHARLFRA